MRRAIPRPWPTVLSLGLLVGGEACLADDSLGHRDNISTGLNQRQKAEMKVPP
ncbi:outer membrane porin, OprD family, partial [Pseudomonas aeruginosa]|nr:outer membrane porin, OprD family [Pseudomonas aeruginosa]